MSSQFNTNVYNYTHEIMKLFFTVAAATILLAACTTPHREHHMSRMHDHDHCNSWQHHDHDDQHGSSYWHTHCTDEHK